MHVHEAVLAGSPQGIAVLSLGAAGAAVGTYLGLRKLDYERVPQVALLSAAFFVVSLVHVPLGGTSVHLVLNGLIGLVLGWTAFPALLIALVLQAVMCQHGGLLALGVNTLNMALPGVAAYYLFHRAVTWRSDALALVAGLGAGAMAVLLSAALTALELWFAGREFALFAEAVLAFHLGVAVVEGLITASAVMFLRKVRPELLDVPLLVPGR
jgi:cobalt/nickel transport system permease protein